MDVIYQGLGGIFLYDGGGAPNIVCDKLEISDLSCNIEIICSKDTYRICY